MPVDASFWSSDSGKVAPLTLLLCVPRKAYSWFKSWKLQDIKKIWPCATTGYKKADQEQLFDALQRFFKQHHHSDGEYIKVSVSRLGEGGSNNHRSASL
jgi:hypothetical protein